MRINNIPALQEDVKNDTYVMVFPAAPDMGTFAAPFVVTTDDGETVYTKTEFTTPLYKNTDLATGAVTVVFGRPDERDAEIAELSELIESFSEQFAGLLAFSVRQSGGDAAQVRCIASAAAPVAVDIQPRAWEPDMSTVPGDPVLDPDGRFIYIFTGMEAMTHSNPTFFPGAAGVHYWVIVPEVHQGHRVYPDVPGIIVAVREGELWWNAERTSLFRWNAVDNDAVVWPPGVDGVHQWVEVED